MLLRRVYSIAALFSSLSTDGNTGPRNSLPLATHSPDSPSLINVRRFALDFADRTPFTRLATL